MAKVRALFSKYELRVVDSAIHASSLNTAQMPHLGLIKVKQRLHARRRV